MKKIIIPAVTAILIIGATAVLMLKPNIRYIAYDTISTVYDTVSSWFSKSELEPLDEKETDRLKLVPYSLSELLSEKNSVLNQSMMLINRDFPLSEQTELNLGEYNGVTMHSDLIEAYRALSSEISDKFDEKLYIMSAYRTADEQLEAIAEEGDKAAELGESEHQAGLGLDVYIKYYAGMGFLDSDVGQYVNKNCQNHGFIIRYPYYGKKSTGFDFEPWHLRYVGHPHAEIISENRKTLEEYFDMLEGAEFWKFNEYLITLQKGDTFMLPENLSDYDSVAISPDNRDGYVITMH